MEDRFKFRAWDKQEKVMRTIAVLRYRDDDSQDLERVAGHWIKDKNGFTDLKNFVLMQCTGLKDKNGKLIYEGDIIKGADSLYGLGKLGLVKYVDGKFDVYGKNDKSLYYDECRTIDEWEVVGNIYETPELLT